MAGKSSESHGLRFLAAVAACSLLLLLVSHPSAWANRKLVTHQGLEAYVSSDFACAQQVSVVVLGDRKEVFAGERRALQRLVGGVRATLGFECSSINDIVLLGQTGGKTVWRGLVSKSNGWVLVDMPFAQAPASKTPEPAVRTPAQPKTAPQQVARSGEGTAVSSAQTIASFGGGALSSRHMEQESGFMMLLP